MSATDEFDVKRREIFANLARVLKPEAHERWLVTPIPALGGQTPVDAMFNGHIDDVVALTRSYLDPSFS